MGMLERKAVPKMSIQALKDAMIELGFHSNYTLLTAAGTEGDASRFLEDPNIPSSIAVVGRDEVEPGTWCLSAGGRSIWLQ